MVPVDFVLTLIIIILVFTLLVLVIMLSTYRLTREQFYRLLRELGSFLGRSLSLTKLIMEVIDELLNRIKRPPIL
jgi:uncharacterized membrane protein (DUF373 family)